ncbi:MAG TPA: RES domain-containing protein, partial [Chloroflexota bacterium]|nr:RES domain-containing protein [Chloroflexota bacterium]
MRLSAWRILKAKYREQPLSGEGARRVGGRWNHRGVPLVYLAESIALATLEILVHLQDTETLPKYALVEV